MNAHTEQYEVVVVGGGAAGLSAALVLGRSRRRTLVVDAGEPRNAPTPHMQGVLSRDGTSPAAYLAAGRAEIAAYGVEWRAGRVTGGGAGRAGRLHRVARGRHGGRRAAARGDDRARRRAAGDRGVAERWGRDVLHCPYCHGWEVRDRPFGVIAHPAMPAHQALMVSHWSSDVTLFPHTAAGLSDREAALLDAAGWRS